MLPISEAQPRTDQMLEASARRRIRIAEALTPSRTMSAMCGSFDATYLNNAFGEELLMQLQLNVRRLVVVYRVLALDALDA